MNKNKKWLAVLVAALMLAACMGCKAEIPPYLIVDGTTVVDYKDELPAKLVIPKGITKIAGGAFKRCDWLESVTIPNSVTEIGYDAFYDCTSLASVTIPNSVTEIGDSAFSGCTSLASVTIPNSVTKIGDWVLSGCTSLASVTIPNSVTEIGYNAFSGCDNIVVVTYNGTLKQWCQMDNNDYYLVSNAKIIRLSDAENLKALTTLTIPNGVTKIGNKAFNDCYKLASVTIPNSVTKIDLAAFSGCTSLASVTYTGTKAQWEAVQKREWNYSVPATVVHCADGDAAL